ncbi:MAG TPA: hypothetical protein GXX51_11305 [Firmicutes bacterium]|nr:hypothetical protein [Bacillota bacterium]
MNGFVKRPLIRGLIAATIAVALAAIVAGCGGGSPSKGSIDGFVYVVSGTKQMAQARLVVTPSDVMMVSGIGLKPEGYEPVAGATVLVEGTNLSCKTGSNGYFRIDGINTGTRTIVVSDGIHSPLRFTVRVLANKVTHVGTQVGYYLFIGINEYEVASDLNWCVADAQSMKEALYDSTPFIGECKLLISYSTATIGNATKEKIKNAILDIASKMTAQDFFVMYFSGHGYRSSDGSVEAICPSDTSSDRIETMITDHELATWFGAMPNRNITVILDSCNSGSFINGRGYSQERVKARAVSPVRMRALSIEGYSVLTAAREDEFSYEDNGHGLFTLYLAEGLDAAHRGQTDTNHDGTITVRELYDYARPKTEDAALQMGLQQHPQIYPQTASSYPPVLRY